MRTLEEKLEDMGYQVQDIKVFGSPTSYETALIGVSKDGRAVYDYDKMIEYLMETQGWDETDSIEWIEYNTMRALPYFESQFPGKAPIIINSLED